MGTKIKMGIDNLGQCDALFRSGEIKPEQYTKLHLLQIKTIVNLEAEYNDQAIVKSQGFNYIYMPLQDKVRPPADFAERFLSFISDNSDAPYLVHCKGGRHRTGIAVGIYRIAKCQWTYDQAKEEADQFTGWMGWFGHGMILDYLRDFAKMKV